MFWVVCYDVKNDRRRKKIMKTLEGFGRWAQFSVFECELNEARLARLEERLKRLINEEEDSVRFYPLNEADMAKVQVLGKGTLERVKPYVMVKEKPR